MAHADSTGVPLIVGTWTGKLTSIYWDQTNAASVRPKKKFKTDVTLTIAQSVGNAALAATIAYLPGLPVSATELVKVGALTGTVGNYHLNLGDQGVSLTIELSGSVNNKGTSMKLTGAAGSSDYTHELKIKLKKQKP